MKTQPKTRKPSAAVLATAKEIFLLLVATFSKEILDAHDGEVKRKLVAEAFDYAVAFHAFEVTA